MIKKRLAIALAITAALAVPFSAFAVASDSTAAKSMRGFLGIDSSKLSDTQKTDVKDYAQKAADLQKDFINKMVANGSMTREEADAAIKKIEDNLNSSIENGVIPGFGFSQGEKNGKGGFDKRDYSAMSAIDTSKLTDQQKAELTDSYKEIVNLQKENVNKMVANGLMTREQGDVCIKKIDEMINGTQKVGITDSLRIFNGFGSFNFFNIKGFDTSKLTEQQKADMKDTADKMTNLQKEVINKLVSFGVMTQEQGDAVIERLEGTSKTQDIRSPQGMKRGHSDSQDGVGKAKTDVNSKPDSTTNSTTANSTTNNSIAPTTKS